MRACIGLHAGLLVGAHDMHTLFMQVRRLLIQLADGLDVCVTWLRVLGPVVIEPVTRLMRFHVHFFLQSDRRGAATYWAQCPG